MQNINESMLGNIDEIVSGYKLENKSAMMSFQKSIAGEIEGLKEKIETMQNIKESVLGNIDEIVSGYKSENKSAIMSFQKSIAGEIKGLKEKIETMQNIKESMLGNINEIVSGYKSENKSAIMNFQKSIAGEIKGLKEKIETISGQIQSSEKLEESVKILNLIRELVEKIQIEKAKFAEGTRSCDDLILKIKNMEDEWAEIILKSNFPDRVADKIFKLIYSNLGEQLLRIYEVAEKQNNMKDEIFSFFKGFFAKNLFDVVNKHMIDFETRHKEFEKNMTAFIEEKNAALAKNLEGVFESKAQDIKKSFRS
jgi:hypothetical protein